MILRPWTSADASALLDAYSGAEMTSQRPPGLVDLDSAVDLIGSWSRAIEERTGFNLAVEVAGVVVGNVAATAINHRHGTAWMSYWTIQRHRSQGYATAGLNALSQLCFETLGLYRLELGHRVNNPASCRVAAGAGYRPEGVEREKLRYGAKRFDVELHARLLSDPEPDQTTPTGQSSGAA